MTSIFGNSPAVTDSATKPADASGPVMDATGLFEVQSYYKDVLDANEARLADRLGLTMAQTAAERRTFTEVVRDLPVALGRVAHNAVTNARLESADEPTVTQRRAQWLEEVNRTARET